MKQHKVRPLRRVGYVSFNLVAWKYSKMKEEQVLQLKPLNCSTENIQPDNYKAWFCLSIVCINALCVDIFVFLQNIYIFFFSSKILSQIKFDCKAQDFWKGAHNTDFFWTIELMGGYTTPRWGYDKDKANPCIKLIFTYKYS